MLDTNTEALLPTVWLVLNSVLCLFSQSKCKIILMAHSLNNIEYIPLIYFLAQTISNLNNIPLHFFLDLEDISASFIGFLYQSESSMKWFVVQNPTSEITSDHWHSPCLSGIGATDDHWPRLLGRKSECWASQKASSCSYSALRRNSKMISNPSSKHKSFIPKPYKLLLPVHSQLHSKAAS